MAKGMKERPSIEHGSMELEGVRYVILRENVFARLCEMANVSPGGDLSGEAKAAGVELDQPSLAKKMSQRRAASGLSQAELARLAGVRPETLNRIERGKTTPDFATIRKLVVAMNEAEQKIAIRATSKTGKQEK